jgi:Ca2+-binding EF-hand superfamily protein
LRFFSICVEISRISGPEIQHLLGGIWVRVQDVDFGIADLLAIRRYISEMKVVVKDRSWLTQVMDFVRGRKDHPSKHEQIFGFLGSSGPSVVISCIKLVLLGSIVSIAALATVLFPLLFELSPVLPFLAIIPPSVTIYQIPKMVTLYTWVCYTEMLKNSEDIISVVRMQKQEKLINILRILSMLSYFLDQVTKISDPLSLDIKPLPFPPNPLDVELLSRPGHENSQPSTLNPRPYTLAAQVQFLKQVAKDGGDISTEAVSDEKWEKIQNETDQAILDDLKSLFDAFDDDESGELDEDEVGALIAQMGTPLSKEEVAGLFKIMDADASGAVDFREFATVVLHQKKQQGGKVNFSELAEKMFAIFDHTGDGVISEEEILTQMESMGKNWDSDSIKYFLNEVDKDGE